MRVKLSGAETKREYIIQSVLHQQVIAKGNPLMLVTFRRELQHIERELERLTSIDEMNSELLTPIRSMLEIHLLSIHWTGFVMDWGLHCHNFSRMI